MELVTDTTLAPVGAEGVNAGMLTPVVCCLAFIVLCNRSESVQALQLFQLLYNKKDYAYCIHLNVRCEIVIYSEIVIHRPTYWLKYT